MARRLLNNSETILSLLRSLYGRVGYSHYKMNKFEEYDLYAHNKDFLISDSVITFTDGNGKLLALKPDVTLSIVKNTSDGCGLKKLYYNENVYRVSKESRNFREILQAGLECIGEIDDYCVFEVIKLALDSLDVIGGRNVLNLSHLGILSELTDGIGVPADKKAEVFRLIGEKNIHELAALLSAVGVSDSGASLLKDLVGTVGRPCDVLPEILRLTFGKVSEKTLSEFNAVVSALVGEQDLIIDFSIVGDLNYYNGFVFKGFTEDVPMSVLSGGQYDMLMRKMGKRSRAIGFAVYLDTIEQYSKRVEDYDVDVLLLYDGNEKLSDVGNAVKSITDGGESVRADTYIPSGVKYKKLMKITCGRIETLENHA